MASQAEASQSPPPPAAPPPAAPELNLPSAEEAEALRSEGLSAGLLQEEAPSSDAGAPAAPGAPAGEAPAATPDGAAPGVLPAEAEAAAKAKAAAPAPEAKPDDPTKPADPPASPEWKSLEEVNVEGVPEIARPHVEKVLALARANEERRTEEVKAAKDGFESVRTQFAEMLGKFEGDQAGAAKDILAGLEVAAQDLSEMQTHSVDIAWMAFEARNPGYHALPMELRTDFANLIADPQFRTRWQGRNDVVRMEEALQFAAFRKKLSLDTLRGAAPPAPAPAPAKGAPPAQAAAPPPPGAPPARGPRQQALVDTGDTASAAPRRGVDEQEFGEILSQHEHLLDDTYKR